MSLLGCAKMVKRLVKNGEKYRGKFVATGSCNDTNVIASGIDPQKVIAKAETLCESPVVFFVPKKNAIHIY
jgi:hypothetical protein